MEPFWFVRLYCAKKMCKVCDEMKEDIEIHERKKNTFSLYIKTFTFIIHWICLKLPQHHTYQSHPIQKFLILFFCFNVNFEKIIRLTTCSYTIYQPMLRIVACMSRVTLVINKLELILSLSSCKCICGLYVGNVRKFWFDSKIGGRLIRHMKLWKWRRSCVNIDFLSTVFFVLTW